MQYLPFYIFSLLWLLMPYDQNMMLVMLLCAASYLTHKVFDWLGQD